MRLEKSSTDGYIFLLIGYARFPFRDFERLLRVLVGLDGDDNQTISNKYNSNFVTYELLPGIYTIKDIAEAVYTMGDHEGALQIEYDNISMKTKII